jgi:hypothetical protein
MVNIGSSASTSDLYAIVGIGVEAEEVARVGSISEVSSTRITVVIALSPVALESQYNSSKISMNSRVFYRCHLQDFRC